MRAFLGALFPKRDSHASFILLDPDSLTGGHPAVAVADAEAAAELAKEEHELGRTPARNGERKRKTMRHDLRHRSLPS